MLLAKESIMAPCNMHELKAKQPGPKKLSRAEELRLEIYEKINAPRHRRARPRRPDHRARRQGARLPVPRRQPAGRAGPNCAATRHVHFHLDGSGPAKLEPPKLEDWPAVTWTPDLKSHPR